MSTGRTNPPERQRLGNARPRQVKSEPPAPDPEPPPGPGLGLAIGRALGTVVVTVRGELTGSTSKQLAEVLRDLIDDQGNLSVVVDARNVTVSSPEGAAMLAVAGQWAHRHGGTLSLAHASEALRRSLDDGAGQPLVRFVD